MIINFEFRQKRCPVSEVLTSCTGLRNRPTDRFSVEWHIVWHSKDLPVCQTDNHDKTKTAFWFLMETACLSVNVSSAKTFFLMVQLLQKNYFSVMQRDTISVFYWDTILFAQQDLIAIIGLYLCTDNQKVLLIIFSRKNSLVPPCMTEKITFVINAPSKRMFVFAELTLTLRQTVFIRK